MNLVIIPIDLFVLDRNILNFLFKITIVPIYMLFGPRSAPYSSSVSSNARFTFSESISIEFSFGYLLKMVVDELPNFPALLYIKQGCIKKKCSVETCEANRTKLM